MILYHNKKLFVHSIAPRMEYVCTYTGTSIHFRQSWNYTNGGGGGRGYLLLPSRPGYTTNVLLFRSMKPKQQINEQENVVMNSVAMSQSVSVSGNYTTVDIVNS